jgi:hypothetical protein
LSVIPSGRSAFDATSETKAATATMIQRTVNRTRGHRMAGPQRVESPAHRAIRQADFSG